LELKGSCGALGIDPARCVALDRPEIQDSPTEWWDQDVIEKIVREYVKKWSVDVVSLSPTLGDAEESLSWADHHV
jgi:N-acetylglucosaminylphosphatidylinositol deacetylase